MYDSWEKVIEDYKRCGNVPVAKSQLSVPADYVYLFIGDRCWGKGNSPQAARKVALANGGRYGGKSFFLWLVDPATSVDGLGDLSWPAGARPPIMLEDGRVDRG